jgi:hypothetical protein
MLWVLPRVANWAGGLIVSPIVSIQTWINTSDDELALLWRDKRSLQTEIDALTQAVAEAQASREVMRHHRLENDRLRGLLGATTSRAVTAAPVLARPSELPFDYLLIGAGSRAGVVRGAPVFAGERVVIGWVVHANPQQSLVELFTTPGAQTTVFVSEANIVAPMEGVGGGVARVRLPQGIIVEPESLVEFIGMNEGVFGTVSYIETAPTQPEQYAYVQPPIPLMGLKTVAVGTAPITAPNTDEITAWIEAKIQPKVSFPELETALFSTSTVGTTSPELEIES